MRAIYCQKTEQCTSLSYDRGWCNSHQSSVGNTSALPSKLFTQLLGQCLSLVFLWIICFCEMNNCLSGNNTPLFFLLLFITLYGMFHSPELYPLSYSRTFLSHVDLLTIPKSFKSEQKSGNFLPLCNSFFLGSKDAQWYPACLCYIICALLTHA